MRRCAHALPPQATRRHKCGGCGLAGRAGAWRGRRCAALATVVAVAAHLLAAPAAAAPCEAVAPVATGSVVVCDGLLWPEPWARQALACLRVDAPRCKADAKLAAQVAAAELAEESSRTAAALAGWAQCEASLAKVPPPGPGPTQQASGPGAWTWLGIGAAAGAALATGALLALRSALR